MKFIRDLHDAVLKKKGLRTYHEDQFPFGFNWCWDISALRGAGEGPLIAIDVGANIGQTAQSISQTFANRQLFCFEPVETSFKLLQKNVAQLVGVEAVHAAVSDQVGKLSMLVDGHSGRNRVSDQTQTENTGDQTELVESITIDSFLTDQKITKLTLLKIDVEGHEMSVLNGAQKAIENGLINYVLCECDFACRPEEPHGNFFDIFKYLTERNYRLVSFYTGGVDDNGWRFGDVLFKMASPNDGSFTNAPLHRIAQW